jgi:hypothetical protein
VVEKPMERLISYYSVVITMETYGLAYAFEKEYAKSELHAKEATQ